MFDITPGHFTGRNLMKRTIIGSAIIAIAALSLGGCLESESEKQAKIEEQKSKDFFDMGGPTDRSKSKGYTP
jgi:basic membrane lipoprotein Med (substrate-binding protein (PBP1-ABC) superfamily)